jgi:hypothetical protein
LIYSFWLPPLVYSISSYMVMRSSIQNEISTNNIHPRFATSFWTKLWYGMAIKEIGNIKL